MTRRGPSHLGIHIHKTILHKILEKCFKVPNDPMPKSGSSQFPLLIMFSKTYYLPCTSFFQCFLYEAFAIIINKHFQAQYVIIKACDMIQGFHTLIGDVIQNIIIINHTCSWCWKSVNQGVFPMLSHNQTSHHLEQDPHPKY